MLSIELCRVDQMRPELSTDAPGAVVIDLFRATSTLQMLVDAGHRDIEIVTTPEAAGSALLKGRRCVGEWLGVTPPGFSCGNSPVRVRALDPEGPPVTFLSSNGAGALAAAARVAEPVYAGNLFALAAIRQAMRERGGDWLLVPAGLRGEPALEDDFTCVLLAGALAEAGEARLGERLTELSRELAGLTVTDLARSAAADRVAGLEPDGQDDVEFILAGSVSSATLVVYADGKVTGADLRPTA